MIPIVLPEMKVIDHKRASDGHIVKSSVTNQPAKLMSKKAGVLRQKLFRFPDEAIYVYSFVENKLIYAEGWEEILGYKDDEITLRQIVSITSPEFSSFSNDLNDKSLIFLNKVHEDLEKYSFLMELKKIHENGDLIPMISRVGVLRAEDGVVLEVIGRFQVNRSLRFGQVMTYCTYGPRSAEFEASLSDTLFNYSAITTKEREALKLAANGLSYKEIASQLGISLSAVEKRILPLYKRFKVKSLSHLVQYANEARMI